jgi:translation elongation factor EF-1alpha
MSHQQEAFQDRPIGQVTHYFGKIGVAAIQLSDTLHLGDQIHIVGHTTDVMARVQSMQIEHHQVSSASTGDSIGIRVGDKVRPGDMVYRERETGGMAIAA